jgi:hypothetical protein
VGELTFQVLTVTSIVTNASWDIAPSTLEKETNVSEVLTDTIISTIVIKRCHLQSKVILNKAMKLGLP